MFLKDLASKIEQKLKILQLIGSLLYLTHSGPDICYAMNSVSRYMQQPHDIHWKVAKRIPQYIQGTRTYGIHYAADSN